MDLSLILFIGGGVVVALGLVFCFFGYKLARILFPLGGLIVLEGVLYIYVYNLLKLDGPGTWLFFGGSAVASYMIMFFIRRIAGFFTGFLGSMLMLLYIINAFSLQDLPYVYPVCLTLCVISGLLTVVYERVAVIIFTSLMGACIAAFAGIYIYIYGIGTLVVSEDVFRTLSSFFSDNAYLITGISAGATLFGIFIQFSVTSSTRVLSGDIDVRSFRVEESRRYKPKDGIYS